MGINRHTNIVSCFLLPVRDNSILLLKRKNTGYFDGYYWLISWHVENNETFTQGMIRETNEEWWIILSPDDIKVVHIMQRKAEIDQSQGVDAYFLCDKWKWDFINAEPHKCEKLEWCDMDNLPSNLIPAIKFAIQNIRNNIFYSEYGWE